jgi:hypothetical protein
MNKKEKTFYLGIIFAIIIYATAHVSGGENSEELKKWSLIGIIIAVMLGFMISSHYNEKFRKRGDSSFGNSYQSGTYTMSFWDRISRILKHIRIPRYRRYEKKTSTEDYSRGYTKQETSEPTYYDILGVSKMATEQEIKTAFRKQILKFHSDKNQIDDADEYVKLLYMIRETLLSSEKRFAYDAMRHGGTV